MKQITTSLTFIVPGLLDPVPYLDQLPAKDLPELPVFSKMLSRGKFFTPDFLDNSVNNLYRCLMKEFISINDGVDIDSEPPVASLSYFFDNKNLSDAELLHGDVSLDESLINSLEDKWIMRADPSFMAADRDQLVLAQTSFTDVTIEEARALANEINHFFADFEEENFWTLKVFSPERWYIVSDKPIRIQSVPPENVLGQSVKSFLFNTRGSTGKEDSGHWLNLFNEFQMILHRSEVNKKRIKEKKIPINSLWFWGAESALEYSSLRQVCSRSGSSIKKQSEVMIYSNNLFARNLSELNNQTCADLPDNFLSEPFLFNWLESNQEVTEQQIIYTIEDFSQAIHNKDIFTWVGLLALFEKNYLEPLIKALNEGRITQIEFVSPSGLRLLVTKKLLKRWWKKTHN